MSKDNQGGPAFPQGGAADDGGRFYDSSDCGGRGITARDYFAAKALQGFCANHAHSILDGPDCFDDAAKEAYQIADAMLRARTA